MSVVASRFHIGNGIYASALEKCCSRRPVHENLALATAALMVAESFTPLRSLFALSEQLTSDIQILKKWLNRKMC
jgi:hypothetical protein